MIIFYSGQVIYQEELLFRYQETKRNGYFVAMYVSVTTMVYIYMMIVGAERVILLFPYMQWWSDWSRLVQLKPDHFTSHLLWVWLEKVGVARAHKFLSLCLCHSQRSWVMQLTEYDVHLHML